TEGGIKAEELILRGKSGSAILANISLKRWIRPEGGSFASFLTIDDWGDPAERMNDIQMQGISDIDGIILEMLAGGEPNLKIAQSLCLSRQGLDYRLKALRKQIGASTRGALVGRAYALGMFEPQSWPPRLKRKHV
ncbi:MAG: hypothetical protein ACRDTD_20220, partial [Pseudonocardiaceae bacterium]